MVLVVKKKWKWKLLSSVQLFVTHELYSSWNSPGQNTGVGSLSLLKGVFPTQQSNPSLPHCRWILYQLSHSNEEPTCQCRCKRCWWEFPWSLEWQNVPDLNILLDQLWDQSFLQGVVVSFKCNMVSKAKICVLGKVTIEQTHQRVWSQK